MNPKGVADGQPVNIPAPLPSDDQGGTPRAWPGRGDGHRDPAQPPRHRGLGKSGPRRSRGGTRSRYGGEVGRVGGQEKPLGSSGEPVPQTDTGRQGEDPKVGERTLVRELGKLTP